MVKTVLGKLRHAIQLWSDTGWKIFFRSLKNRIYSKTTYIGIEKDLNGKNEPVSARIDYNFRLATEEDMKEAFGRARTEDKETARELLHRKAFYEAGYRRCYIARANDNNEVCHLKWIITKSDIDGMEPLYKYILARLRDEDCVTENTFTFPKYRKARVGAAVRYQLSEMAKKEGFKRMIGYVEKGNPPALKSFLLDGYMPFEEVYHRRLFFLSKMSHRPITKTDL